MTKHYDPTPFAVVTALGIAASSYGLPMQSLILDEAPAAPLTGHEVVRVREARNMAIYLICSTLDFSESHTDEGRLALVAHLFNVNERRVLSAIKHISHERFANEAHRLGNVLQWVLNMAEFTFSPGGEGQNTPHLKEADDVGTFAAMKAYALPVSQ